ncbi:hypothetical protein HH310_32315 [Actinoplanes sp. TBRC 11911]|uniref:hypothetical protein n=1 Tax=Actinoplanes sp. TBRC 11911 TaxID=2729386 RepID=UPI00145C53EA|nr:hypothetical protein [Actinoplanes sp. TBRC 11911]NMO55854.1 hypothetical protein [Actinoplanes sp. TBRC 11911]
MTGGLSGAIGSPVASAPVSGNAYGQPPTYVPGLPDPSSGPVSGLPAPRPASPSPLSPAAGTASVIAPATAAPPADANTDEDLTTRRTPSPRRSASLEDAEPAHRGRRAAPDPDDDFDDDPPLRPGDVAEGQIAFWDDEATDHFRAAWHEVKAEFVDDPVTALTRAHDLLTDAVNELTEALLAERDELDPLRGTATPDTESMRMAMRGYREFLDRILAL